MRRALLSLAILFIVFLPFGVRAQDPIKLSKVSVDIWPEYDQPAVLVIYHISLAAGTPLPAMLSLHLPAQANVTAVATQDPSGNLVDAPFERVIQAKTALLTITADSLQVQVEYYTTLVKSATTRKINFEWAGDYALDYLDVYFLRPDGATDVVIDPEPLGTSIGQDGLLEYHIQLAHLAAGQAYAVNIEYARQSDDLGISSLPVQAITTPGPTTPGRVALAGVVPGILLGVGIVFALVGLGGLVLWRQGERKSARRDRHKAHSVESPDGPVYCQECGKRAQPGDLFCRTCGTRLKQKSAEE
jgi:hypothetical protein